MFFGFTVLWSVICFGVVAGLFIIIFVLLPITLYTAPYLYWVGSQRLKGKYLEKDVNKSLCIIDATRVYKSWITHKEPQI